MSSEYKKIARYYDRASAWALNPVRAKIAADAKRAGLEKVLDIGCGTGLQLQYLRRQGIKVGGADSSAEMLDEARKRLCGADGASSQSDGDCPLVLSAATELPFEDGSFDLALISLVLHESEADPDLILREALRVAGQVWILEWSMAERNLDYPVQGLAHLIEMAAGMRHYRAFRAFMRKGGVERLISRHDAEIKSAEHPVLRVLERKRMLMGTLSLIKTARAEAPLQKDLIADSPLFGDWMNLKKPAGF